VTNSKVVAAIATKLIYIVSLLRFLGRKEYNDVPMREHFEEANDILAAVWSMAFLDGASINEDDAATLLRVTREHLISRDRHRHRTRSALEAVTSLNDLQHIVARNGTAQATVGPRSPEWLEENGEAAMLYVVCGWECI
jgi:hypothetical protein